MFDIASQAVADTATIHLKGADGEYLYSDGKPVQIVAYGPASPQFEAVEARQTARVLKRREENDGKPAVPSPDQRREEQAEDLAMLTVAFQNFTYPPAGDKQGHELFLAFYSNPKLGYMHAQVLKAVQNWGNFRRASATS